MVGSSFSSDDGNTPQRHPKPKPTKQLDKDYLTSDLDVPTITQLQLSPTAIIPPRPKIVVFGASGRIGRRVLRRLLSSGVDMDVVAYVRDEKKLERVLYEEGLGGMSTVGGRRGRKNDKGPKLQVVVGNLVSNVDVFRGQFETEEEKRVLDLWVDKAANYFRSIGDDSNSTTNITSSMISDEKVKTDIDIMEANNEAIQEAIAGSTIIVSCVGTSRQTNFYTDYLCVPFFRILRKDVSKWCSDPRHPYYVNYLSTKKILEEAENEQRRREAMIQFQMEKMKLEEEYEKRRTKKEEEGFESSIAANFKKRRGRFGSDTNYYDGTSLDLPEDVQLPTSTDRIKLIRISDANVGRNPWRLGSIVTNVFRSVVFRYHEMGEKLLEGSEVVDTIVLRAGELTDEERVSAGDVSLVCYCISSHCETATTIQNTNHTSLQLSTDGKVATPCLVGRDDVADIAVVAALTTTSNPKLFFGNDTDTTDNSEDEGGTDNATIQATSHYTWALRWTGQHLSPPQGLRPDGLSTAALCFVKAIKAEIASTRQKRVESRRQERMKQYHGGNELVRIQNWLKRRLNSKPHALSAALAVYMTLSLISWFTIWPPLVEAFGRARRFNVPQLLTKLLS